jgi:hypothetical protein
MCATIAGFAGAPAAVAGGSAKNPTQKEIRAAVAQAKRSPHLWATVNTCDTRKHPNVIAIRAQMPSFGFPTRMSELIKVDYWDAKAKRFRPDPSPGAHALIQLGVVSFGYEQGGRAFKFQKHAGLLRGTVTFQWKRSGKVLLTLTRHTTSGHQTADHGDPRGYSAAHCRIR